MSVKIVFILALTGIGFQTTSAQQLEVAQQTIEALTSRDFAGRGYVQDGCTKAARFISHEFQSDGLQPFTKNYAQPFSFSVNTFPRNMSLKIGERELEPGIDFIVHPASGGACRSYSVEKSNSYSSPDQFNHHPGICISFRPDSLPEEERKKLIKDLEEGKIKSGALLLRKNKLTWSVSQFHFSIPVIYILNDSFPPGNYTVDLCITQKQLTKFTAENIIGYVKGAVRPDSFIVFSAHYDHLGMMGRETWFPGANDNASGVSMLLALADHFSKPENRPKYSVAFIAFAGEEAGLLGSEFYTEHPLFPLAGIRFLVNLDLLGTGEDGMMVVNATEFPEQFHLLDSLNQHYNYLPAIRQRGKAKNSDHYFFSEKGVPCFFFYTLGGIQAYHDINDIAATLPLTEFEDIFRLIVRFEEVMEQ